MSERGPSRAPSGMRPADLEKKSSSGRITKQQRRGESFSPRARQPNTAAGEARSPTMKLPTLSLTGASGERRHSLAQQATAHSPTSLTDSPRGHRGRRRSSVTLGTGGLKSPSQHRGRRQSQGRRPSFHMMNVIDQCNNLTAEANTPDGGPLNRSSGGGSSTTGGRASPLAAGSPATGRPSSVVSSVNLHKPPGSGGGGLGLRSQLRHLDDKMLRTFDSKTGTIEVSHKSAVPQRDRLVKQKYLAFWRNEEKVREAEEVVKRLSIKERRAYAIESVKRKHIEELKRILQKDVLGPEIAVTRVNVSLKMSLEHIVGHLDLDTRELSLIRMHAAAADTVLYKEAERKADAEIQHFHAKVIPPNTTAVELMSMAIDSYKERFVPAPPRQLVSGSPALTKSQSRLHRRPSGVFPFGVASPSAPPSREASTARGMGAGGGGSSGGAGGANASSSHTLSSATSKSPPGRHASNIPSHHYGNNNSSSSGGARTARGPGVVVIDTHQQTSSGSQQQGNNPSSSYRSTTSHHPTTNSSILPNPTRGFANNNSSSSGGLGERRVSLGTSYSTASGSTPTGGGELRIVG